MTRYHQDPDDARDDMLLELEDARLRRDTAVNLDGLPRPDNMVVTDHLLTGLLAALERGDDAAVVRLVAGIGDVAGWAYGTALADRVAAVYRRRDEAKASVS